MTVGRRLLPATVVATFSLILIGVYTAAIGAGLGCDARWPLCDGAVFGLFPANWPSFVEWFHRLVAMVTGFLILASWWAVWRNHRSRAARIALTVAVVLLPVQIWLGAQTVLQYEVIVLITHFLTALVIFGALIAGTWWWMGPDLPTPRRRWLAGGLLVLVVPFVTLTPHFLVVHTGPVQVGYYAIGLVMFGGLLTLLLDAVRSGDGWPKVGVAALGLVALSVQLIAGRLVRSPTVHGIDWVAAGALVILLIAGFWSSRGARPARDSASID